MDTLTFIAAAIYALGGIWAWRYADRTIREAYLGRRDLTVNALVAFCWPLLLALVAVNGVYGWIGRRGQ